jgi:hypothetical protein
VPESVQSIDVNQEIKRLDTLTQEWVQLFPQAVSQGERWQKVLSQVRVHLAEDVTRVAVVGTVKSGKSTLINALVGRDILKRGAGILTAMITRVQPGPKPRALLKFKEWSEVTEEVHRTLGLLPNDRLLEHAAPFNLQQAADRELLAQILVAGQDEDLWSKGSLSENYYLLKSYLEGYDLLKDYLAKGHDLSLVGPDFLRHREMVTQEACSVYLKDALLTVPTPWLPEGVELGDCQGSDSPIPQHLTQVLAYLSKTDLVLYVISSRIGLRKADFQFLGELKRMGLGDHLLFLLNIDLTEHRGLAEIEQLRERVREELAPWIHEPYLAVFSALKVLLDRGQSQGEELEPRETALLQVWAADQETAAFSEREFQQFAADFEERLRRLKTQRLLGGSLPQVRMVARGFREQVELAQGLLRKDLSAFQEMEARLKERRQPLGATKNTLKQALEGAGARLKTVLKGRVSSYFDLHMGKGDSLPQFIAGYQPDWEHLVPAGAQEPFKTVVYRLFQDFQRELTRFASGEFNLQALEFIRNQEDWVQEELQKTIAPLFVSLQEALTLYYREIEALGLPGSPPQVKPEIPVRSKHMEVPLLSLPLELDWRWAGEVWMRSGMGALRRAWQAVKRKLGRKVETDPRDQQIHDLARALKTIKAWLQEQVRVQLIDYGERLKFRYFFPLVDEATKRQEANLDALIGSLTADLEGLADALRQEEADREARQSRLKELAPQIRSIEARLTAAAG